jgi:hypothetical protein
MTDENPASRLPVELSSVVTALEAVTRELTKKLSREEAEAVVTDLCERLQHLPEDEQRGPNRPFSR